jgi:hypothetical protein
MVKDRTGTPLANATQAIPCEKKESCNHIFYPYTSAYMDVANAESGNGTRKSAVIIKTNPELLHLQLVLDALGRGGSL